MCVPWWLQPSVLWHLLWEWLLHLLKSNRTKPRTAQFEQPAWNKSSTHPDCYWGGVPFASFLLPHSHIILCFFASQPFNPNQETTGRKLWLFHGFDEMLLGYRSTPTVVLRLNKSETNENFTQPNFLPMIYASAPLGIIKQKYETSYQICSVERGILIWMWNDWAAKVLLNIVQKFASYFPEISSSWYWTINTIENIDRNLTKCNSVFRLMVSKRIIPEKNFPINGLVKGLWQFRFPSLHLTFGFFLKLNLRRASVKFSEFRSLRFRTPHWGSCKWLFWFHTVLGGVGWERGSKCNYWSHKSPIDFLNTCLNLWWIVGIMMGYCILNMVTDEL